MDSQRPSDVSPEAMQARIQQARREAETLKDRIKRKKDELADTTRESHRRPTELLLLFLFLFLLFCLLLPVLLQLSPFSLLIHLHAMPSSAQLLTLFLY